MQHEHTSHIHNIFNGAFKSRVLVLGTNSRKTLSLPFFVAIVLILCGSKYAIVSVVRGKLWLNPDPITISQTMTFPPQSSYLLQRLDFKPESNQKRHHYKQYLLENDNHFTPYHNQQVNDQESYKQIDQLKQNLQPQFYHVKKLPHFKIQD